MGALVALGVAAIVRVLLRQQAAAHPRTVLLRGRAGDFVTTYEHDA